MIKKYNKAPLPFIGQKRLFLKSFKQILNDNIPDDGEGWTIVDVFGGSGLLAHTAKQLKPNARVIYNDFDGYAERLNYIDDTNQLRQRLYNIIGHLPQKSKLSIELREKVVETITLFNGYVDTLTIGAWLLFSGNSVKTIDQILKHNFYNILPKTNYNCDGYLEGIEIINDNFKSIMTALYDQPNTLLILDPPYICTDQGSYGNKLYFDLIDFLELADLTRPPFIFFSSTKSEFIRFIEWANARSSADFKAFEDVSRITLNTGLNHSKKYEDNLIYRFK